MAVHANSTSTPARPLLAKPRRASERSLDASGYHHARATTARQSDDELLAILDAGPLSPADLAVMSQQRRKRAQDGIDALIAALDALDPDPDLEPTMAGGNGTGQVDECEPDADEEQSIGAPEVEFSEFTGRIVRHDHIDQRRWADGRHAVNGWDVDREHDPADDEPVLGAPEQSCTYSHMYDGRLDQKFWARGGGVDEREDVSEDEGACIQSQPHDAEPNEPSLGALEGHIDQTAWGEGYVSCSEESEPNLGASENPHDQRRWSQGRRGSQELDCDEHPVSTRGAYDRAQHTRRDTEAMLRHRGLLPTYRGNVIPLTADMMMCRGVAW